MTEHDTIRYSIYPGITTRIIMKTLPDATCNIHKEYETDIMKNINIFSDHNGIINFYATPEKSEFIGELLVDCNINGNVTTYPLELHVNHNPKKEIPAPPSNIPTSSNDTERILPALSLDEVLNLSDQKLLDRGYPFRPNKKNSPNAFVEWQTMVSRPLTIVKPTRIPNRQLSHTIPQIEDDQSNTWSGYMLTSGGPYGRIAGEWTVPEIPAERGNPPGGVYPTSALWVGLDGWTDIEGPKPPLVQAGTIQDYEQLCFGRGILSHCIGFALYYPWTEFLPNEPFTNAVSDLRVQPGEDILVNVWVGSSTEMHENLPVTDLNGDCCFYFLNKTTNSATPNLVTKRSGTTVNGTTAEWIMERLTVTVGKDQIISDLANYNVAVMGTEVTDLNYNSMTYSGTINTKINMVNNKTNNLLSESSAYDSASIRYNWRASN